MPYENIDYFVLMFNHKIIQSTFDIPHIHEPLRMCFPQGIHNINQRIIEVVQCTVVNI